MSESNGGDGSLLTPHELERLAAVARSLRARSRHADGQTSLFGPDFEVPQFAAWTRIGSAASILERLSDSCRAIANTEADLSLHKVIGLDATTLGQACDAAAEAFALVEADLATILSFAAKKMADEQGYTPPMTRTEFATLHKGVSDPNPSQYVKRLLKGEEIAEPVGRGRLKRYRMADLPPAAQQKLRAKYNKT